MTTPGQVETCRRLAGVPAVTHIHSITTHLSWPGHDEYSTAACRTLAMHMHVSRCLTPTCAAPGPSARFAPKTRKRQGISGEPSMLTESPRVCRLPAHTAQSTAVVSRPCTKSCAMQQSLLAVPVAYQLTGPGGSTTPVSIGISRPIAPIRCIVVDQWLRLKWHSSWSWKYECQKVARSHLLG